MDQNENEENVLPDPEPNTVISDDCETNPTEHSPLSGDDDNGVEAMDVEGVNGDVSPAVTVETVERDKTVEPAVTTETIGKDEAGETEVTEESVCPDPDKAESDNIESAEVVVEKEVAVEEKQGKDLIADEELARKKTPKWEDVEAAALDFVVDNLHHPVVSCYRELTKNDVHQIFNQARFKSAGNEVEEAIMCITLMDYIATSLNNPLYSDHFAKSVASVRPCVKVIFTETRRVLKTWMSSNPSTFLTGKRMVLKYLQSLSPYFKHIQYEKTYLAAVNCLEKDVARAHREASKAKQRKPSSNVLNEVPQNTSEVEDAEEKEVDGGLFDFIDEVPIKPQSSPAPTNANKITSTKPKSKAMTTLKNFFEQTGKRSVPEKNNSSSLKRPASTELDQSNKKKVCTSPKAANASSAKPEEKSQTPKNGTGPISKYFVSLTTEDGGGEKKEKVNAFALLMNRSKELAKASKAKKQASSPSVTTTPRAVYTVE